MDKTPKQEKHNTARLRILLHKQRVRPGAKCDCEYCTEVQTETPIWYGLVLRDIEQARRPVTSAFLYAVGGK